MLEAFICQATDHTPGCDPPRRFTYEEALDHFPFAHGGIIPAFVLRAIWEGEHAPHHNGDHFSPSMAGGCMKEVILQRVKPWAASPFRLWKMMEGTLWHRVAQGAQPAGWRGEVRLPEDRHALAPDDESLRAGFRETVDGVLEYEWEGMWMSGTIDALHGPTPEYPHGLLEDYKSQDCPKTNFKQEYFPPKRALWGDQERDWPLQLGLYGWMYADLEGLPRPPDLRAFQYVKGIQKAEYSWVPIPVPLLGREELAAAVRPNYLLFKTAWVEYHRILEKEGPAAADLVLAAMPLQGRPKYNGKKCPQYCAVKPHCDETLLLNPAMASGEV